LRVRIPIDIVEGMGIRGRVVAAGVLVAVGGMAIVSACDPSYGETPVPDAGNADSLAPASETGTPGATDPCSHVGPPGPPALEDDGASLPAFAMALEKVVVGRNTDGVLAGFDLDGVCTCESRPNTAFDGGASCQGLTAACDGEGGLDNALGPLADTFKTYFSFDGYYNSVVARGRSGLLFELSEYNGRANDKSVRVAVYVSDGIPAPTCPGSMKDASRENYSPGWCGDDTWSINVKSVVSDTIPAIVLEGWVHDGHLVARAADGASIALGMFGNAYTSFVASGKLVALGEDLAPRDPARAPTEKEKRLYRLENGTLGGRIAAKDLLSQLGHLNVAPDGGANQLLCESASFSTVKEYVCSAADLSVAPSKDHVPGTGCDALSVGYAFTAAPALKGGVSSVASVPTRCDPNPDGTTDAGASYLCP
jgi:hypothetical protein